MHSTIAKRAMLVAALIAITGSAQEAIHPVVPTHTDAASNRFFSPAIDAGDYVYISGQGPRRPDGTVPSSSDGQVRQALENIKEILDSAHLSVDHVVYTQVYLEDITKYAEMNKAFADFFGKMLPARAVLGVARVPESAVEINAVAVRDIADKKPVYPPNYKSDDPAPPAILTHDRLFISGMTGTDGRGIVPQDPATQVDLALNRMESVVKAAGLELKHVVFVNPYLTADIPHHVMNTHYAQRFEFGNTPARATIEVTSLPGGAHIEYTGVAVRDLTQRKAIRPKNMPPSPTASPCVFAGDTLYCSAKDGFIPGPHAGIYAATTQHQLRQSMRNQLDNLEEADMNFNQVVSTNVYLDNLSDLSVFNDVYAQYFSSVPPARTTVQQIAPTERKADKNDQFPGLEQFSLIAVRNPTRH
jgi:reactive intermediate/imine deaminase